jgi:AcrR family transcriptional regulator
MNSLSFTEFLEARSAAPDKRKGERTRDRMKAAAARELERVGYRELRVSDVNETAGVSNALFYVYFKNLQDVTAEVLTEFLETLYDRPPDAARPASPAEAIYAGNLHYIRRFAANPGLMRCLFQFGDEIPEFGELWRKWNREWIDRVLRSLQRDKDVALDDAGQRMIAAAALGTMVDGVLRFLYVDREQRLIEAAEREGPESLALLFTRLWFRALYAREMTWSPASAQAASPEAAPARPARRRARAQA